MNHIHISKPRHGARIAGTVVTVRLAGESALISPSLGSTPVHRNAWVSGGAQVELSGENAESGRIYPGYVVGCQVNISGGGVTGGVDGQSDWEGKASGGAKTGANLSLGPGHQRLGDLRRHHHGPVRLHRVRPGAGVRAGQGVHRHREVGGHPLGSALLPGLTPAWRRANPDRRRRNSCR